MGNPVSWSTPDRSLADSVSSSAHRFGFLSMIVISLLPPSSVNRHYEQHQASNGFCLAMINFFSAIVRVAFQLQEEKNFFSPRLSLTDWLCHQKNHLRSASPRWSKTGKRVKGKTKDAKHDESYISSSAFVGMVIQSWINKKKSAALFWWPEKSSRADSKRKWWEPCHARGFYCSPQFRFITRAHTAG